ncbi:MAG: response regulator [Chloroflexi bacterium]|nr:response regulator [Chloroflexota bacterium]
MIDALIVEDEADIRNLLGEQLQDKGCAVRKASNGAAGLRSVNRRKPDIMFVVIMMPVMDGIDLISELHKNPETVDIPVVLVTGVSAPAETMKVVGLGVRYRLSKPWKQEELDFVFEQSLKNMTGTVTART